MDQELQDKILKYCMSKRDEAKTHWEDYIEPFITKNRRIWKGDKDYYAENMPYLETKSQYISADVYSTIESKVAKQLKIYFGGVDVIQVQGTKGNPSEQAAKDRQDLINYQLIEVNKGFTKFKHWFTDAFTNRVGFVKVYPKITEDWVEQQPIPIPFEALAMFEEQIKQDKTLRIKSKIPSDMGVYTVVIEKKQITESYPKIELVPAYEFLVSPRAKSIATSEFVCHRTKRTIDELRRNKKRKLPDGTETGMYWPDAVEKIAKEGDEGETTVYEQENYQERDKQIVDDDGPGKEVQIYECYIMYDINDDGLLEPVVATICGNTLLRAEENNLGRPPFFKVSPNEEPGKIWPDIGMIDFVCKLAEMDTATWRLWIANLAQNNDPQMGILMEYIEDLDDVENRKKMVKIRGTDDIRKVIQQISIGQLDPSTINFLELKDQKLEKISAVTRINQGVGGEVEGLNKTATGMNLTVSLSNQDDENIARCFAESEDGIGDMFEFMVELNEKYPPPVEEVMELIGHELTPLPGNTKLRYVVDPTLGTGVKQQNLQNYQMMAQDAPLLVQAGIMDLQNVFNLKRRQYEEMGVRNEDEYLKDPSKQPPQQPQPDPKQVEKEMEVKIKQVELQMKMIDLEIKKLETGINIANQLGGLDNGSIGLYNQGGPVGGMPMSPQRQPQPITPGQPGGVGNQNTTGSRGNSPI